MAQQQSPWLETAYGWAYGENGWNTGMDSNLLKFSVLFDRNVDSVVASLPAAVNGQVHYNTSDNRLYFAVNTTYFSSPVPKWFILADRSTGGAWQFDGSALTQVDSPSSINTRLEAVELTVSTLGTAAFEDVSAFATQAELDIVEGQAQTYTDNLRADLLAGNGSGIVGFDSAQVYPSGSVGFELSVLTKAIRFVTPQQFGAIADGTSHPLSEFFATLAEAQAVYPHATALTDQIDWAAFQSALNAGVPAVYTPGGHYVFNRGNTRTSDIRLFGDGYSSHLDYSSSASGLLIQGALTQIGDLSSNVALGARALTFGAAPAVGAGGVLIVFNPTDGSWLADRAPYREGEFFRVHSVAGSVATVYGNSTSAYTAANMDVYRLDGVRAVVENLRATPSATFAVAPIKVLFGDGVRLSNYWASNVNLYTGFEVERSFDVTLSTITSLNNSPAVGDEYGFTISNCQNVTVTGGASTSTRHALALGGMDDVCCVPNRNVLISGLTLENIDIASDIGAGDMHGNCDNVTYDNCILRNGGNMQGRNATFRNCTIYGVSSVSGEAIYGSEIYGGVYTVENCRIVSFGNGASFGIIHITPGTSQREKLHLICRNNTLELPSATISTKAVFLRARSAPLASNAVIDGMTVIAPTAMQAFLFADDQNEVTMISDYLIVDNVYGPSGTSLIYPIADIAAVPTRQMRQCGSVTLTTTAATLNAASAQTFRYPYSKVPAFANVGVAGVAGATMGLLGGQIAVPVVRALTATAITPAVQASANFTAGASASLQWEAEIREV